MANRLTPDLISAETRLPGRLFRWVGCISLMVLWAIPLSAQARIETLNWFHPSPAEVEGFRVHYGTSSGHYQTVVDVGFALSYDLSVPDEATIYVALTAYSGRVESALSNEVVRPGEIGTSAGSWSDDFETSATGSFIPDWFDTDTSNSFAESDALFDIAELGGDRVLRTQSTLMDIHSHYIGGEAWSNYEVRARVRVTSPMAQIGITSHCQYPFEDAYYSLSTDGQTGELELSGHPEPWPSQEIACSSQTTGVVAQTDTWYWLALEVVVGNLRTDLRGKVWREDQAEPVAWQAHCWHQDPSLPAVGTVGVWSAGAGAKYWDDVQVSFVPSPGPGLQMLTALVVLGFESRRRRGATGTTRAA